MILYHGSNAIVEYPEIRKAKYNKDFYFGFYCTRYQEQAERWATRYGKKGYVNQYEYEPNEKLNYLLFEEMTEEWLDFIVACRQGKSDVYKRQFDFRLHDVMQTPKKLLSFHRQSELSDEIVLSQIFLLLNNAVRFLFSFHLLYPCPDFSAKMCIRDRK